MSTPRDSPLSLGYALRGAQGRVIDAIGRSIVAGRYRPGDALPREPELAAEHGVSRTSIREAMKVLAAKGLIAIRQKVGTTVRPQEMWDTFDTNLLTWYHEEGLGEAPMRDLIELRQILEPAAARLAAGRATMADLRRLSAAVERMNETTHTHTEYAVSDVEFHLAVYAASHNSMLQRFGRLVADFMVLSFEMQQEATAGPTALDTDATRHAAVLDAINRGEAAEAGSAMLDVVLDGKQALIAALESRTRREAETG